MMEKLQEKRIEASLEKARAEIKELEAKAQKGKAELKARTVKALQDARSKQQALGMRLRELKDAGEDAAEKLGKDLSRLNDDLKASLKKARDAVAGN